MDKMEILERLDRVMQVEATVPSKGNFMLTHVPFDNLFYGVDTPISEKDLLNNYLFQTSSFNFPSFRKSSKNSV